MNRWLKSMLAFEPPSDYVGNSGSGGGRSKIWMVLGGGCLTVILLIGLAFAAGAFKAVSCCGDFKQVAERSMAAQAFGGEFADAIARDEIDRAWGMMDPDYTSENDRAAFDAVVTKHREFIKSSGAPRMLNMQVQQQGGEVKDIKAWRQSWQYSGASAETMLVMDVRVVQKGEGNYSIASLDFDTKRRNLAMEPPALEVLEFHDELQRDNIEMAFGRLGDQFKKGTDVETFRTFIDDQGDLFTDSEMQIRQVYYDGAQSATVMAYVESETGKKGIVQYELASPPNFPMWKILVISPMLQAEQLDSNAADAGGSEDTPDASEGASSD